MSALALILHKRGVQVSGSDAQENPQVRELQRRGIRVNIGHREKNLSKSHTAENCRIIINGAIADSNPELSEARKRDLEIVDRATLLAEIASTYKNVIAIAGTHGKSTTTAMIGTIFKFAGTNPTIHNGATSNQSQNLSNLSLGGDEYFITEACEFKRSFLTLRPTTAVITNISPDHMDCYKDVHELNGAFDQFAQQSGKTIHARDLVAENIVEYAPSKYSFDFMDMKIELNVVGRHNVDNAMAAVSVALEHEIDKDTIVSALKSFGGIMRRFETLGNIEGRRWSCDIISDYAHHPNEIATTIATAERLYKKYLIIFQPHTYTRTKFLHADFVELLRNVDIVFYKTYSAREKPIKGARAKDLARHLDKPYFSTKFALRRAVRDIAEHYDAIIFTGAGDIDAIARSIIKS